MLKKSANSGQRMSRERPLGSTANGKFVAEIGEQK